MLFVRPVSKTRPGEAWMNLVQRKQVSDCLPAVEEPESEGTYIFLQLRRKDQARNKVSRAFLLSR